jgi:filamentous hemagglutinin
LALLQDYHLNHAEAFRDPLMYGQYLSGLQGYEQRQFYEENLNYRQFDPLGAIGGGAAGSAAAGLEVVQGFNELMLGLMNEPALTSEQISRALLAAAANLDEVVSDYIQASQDAELQGYLYRLQGDEASAAYVEEKWNTEFLLNFVAVSRAGQVGRLGGGATREVKVDTSRASRGTPEYETLNNPPPNTRVELDNGTTFRTNEGGYVEEITYQPVDSPGVRDRRQTAVGKEGIVGDVGGHVQACRHGGTCDRFNLFPQNSNFNNSAYRGWENQITSSLQNGDNVDSVTVRFERSNPNSARPDALRVEYSINGVPETRRFINQAGGGL